jgi:hypothetical protein
MEAQYSSFFTSQQSIWKQDTRLALRHNFSSWKHSTSLISMSCFMSQHLRWKQDTRLALRHNCQARSTILVSSHCLALRHSNKAGSKRCLITATTPPFEEGFFRTIPSLSRKCSNFTRDRGLVNTSTTCSSVLMYWSFKAPLCTMSRM